MNKPFNNILDTIGNTPVIKLNKLAAGIKSNIFAKCEFFNPGGSVKDRIGRYIIEAAEKRGELKPGATIVEGTSGNTGVGLAITAAIKGYKCIFVMPDKMSEEKIRLLRAFGAKVIITPTAVEPDDPRSYYSVAKRIVDETPNSFYANQYHNPDNPETHYKYTGPELWEQMDGKIDTFVIGLGTGGTVSGVGKYLKEQNPKIKVLGVDPIGSLYTEYFKTGKLGKAEVYKVEGIGEDFLPTTMDFSVVDEVMQITDKESFQMARQLVKQEGIFAGGSSGTAVSAALRYARGLQTPENIVVLLPDSGNRYLSKVFNDEWMRENGFLDSEPEGTASGVLSASGRSSVLTASPNDSIRKVVSILKEYSISQLPVVEDNKIVGIVNEQQLLQALLDETYNAEQPIKPLMSDQLEIVSEDESIDRLTKHVSEGRTAVVYEGSDIKGIITKIDIISYYANQRGL